MSLLDKLNDPQREAVTHKDGPLLILAGAGSGKTRVITHRIAYLIEEYDVNPYRILAITFTNKAAKEMRERVDNILDEGAEDVFISTFHSMCVRFLRKFIDRLGYTSSFTIYDTDDTRSLMRECIKALNYDPKNVKEKEILNQISSAKNELISPEEYERTAMTPNAKLVAVLYKEYERRLKANNAMDFDDLLVKTVKLFREHPDALDFYRRRFRYIMVDEYQDTNTAQFQIVKMLAHYVDSDGNVYHNLCVVGDDDQSIYGFRGADIKNILNFENEYPEAKVIKLEENYRSSGNILSVANAVIKNNKGRKSKALWTSQGDGAPVYLNEYDSDQDEAVNVAEKISSLLASGAKYSDFAILYRTNAQSLLFEKALRLKNIKAKTIGALSFFQRKEIKDMIAYLKLVDNTVDDLAVKRIINVPKRGIGLTTIEKIDVYANSHNMSFYEALLECRSIAGIERAASKIEAFTAITQELIKCFDEDGSIAELIDIIVAKTGYEDELKEDPETAEDRIANIDALISYAARYAEDNEDEASLTGFLEYCGLNGEDAARSEDDEEDEPNNFVSLMTIHTAKGTEFPYVFLTGMEEGVFPSYVSLNSDNPDAEVEEERRLCYVGITRAMKELYMSNATQRFMHGSASYNKVSRFVGEIPRYLIEFTPSARKAGNRYSASAGYGSSPIRNSSFGSDDRNAAKKYAESKPYGFGGSGSGSGSSYGSGSHSSGSLGSASTNPYAAMLTKGIDITPSGSLSYEVGDTVKHVKFGVGKVLSIVKGGRDYEVTVEFENFGTKKMLSAFAKLEKL